MSPYRIFFAAMGSRCEVQLVAVSEARARKMAQFAIDEVKRIESKYSRYRPDSIVSRITAQAGQDWVHCDEETLLLLDYADRIFSISGGLFDITSGALRNAWNFQRVELPSDATLRKLCDLVDWQCVQREGRFVRLPKAGMELDLGGFCKEYAADQGALALKEHGVTQGYVNLGGDIRVVGPKPGNRSWNVGIQDPRNSDKVIASISLAGGGLATSGDYERYFELNGQRYCHILHPKSGRPVTYWRSVSVQAPSALTAGSLSTIAMLKQEQGLPFLDQENVTYMAVLHDGTIHYSNRSMGQP